MQAGLSSSFSSYAMAVYSLWTKDRSIYREFGLFVKSLLPGEAEHLKVDLHLARGRSVMTKLVPSGVAEFTKDEVTIIF